MLEVSGVVDARSQKYAVRHCDMLWREKFEHVAQSTWVAGHWPNFRSREHLRKHALHDRAILQHVRNARWTTQIVFEHVDLSVAVAHEVSPGNMTPNPARRIKADALLA